MLRARGRARGRSFDAAVEGIGAGGYDFLAMQMGARGLAGTVALASVVVAVHASGCSALVDRADAQCTIDADCARFGAYVCDRGGCVPGAAPAEAGAEAAPPVSCDTTAACVAAHGASWICRHADATCVPLVSPDCPTVVGDYTRDDALLLGALLPLDGPHSTTGAAMQDALRLAVMDFAAGLPAPGGGRRPLAVVVCNESNDVDRAATHLHADLLVPAVVGTGDSASTLAVARDVTIPGLSLLVSPRATAGLSSGTGGGLLWRTCPSDAYESAAIVALAQGVVVPAVVAEAQLTSVRVALVHATDVASTEMDTAIVETLHINGSLATDPSNAGRFLHVDFGDPDDLAEVDASAKMATAVDAVTAPASLPDVVLVLGSTQAVTGVVAGIERAWPAGARSPRYVVSSGLQTSELLALSSASKAGLAPRVLGTAPGGNGANVDAFLAHYADAYSDGTAPQTFGVAQTYDALYAIAFAAAAAAKPSPQGTELAAALAGLVTPGDAAAPVPIEVGPGGIAPALAAIAAGQPLRLDGASAPLAFDPAADDVTTDVQVWCMLPAGAGGSLGFVRAGMTYHAPGGPLDGALVPGCQP
jgi:ABC-type branched-subunit amino acid transport system substrate-binding protein